MSKYELNTKLRNYIVSSSNKGNECIVDGYLLEEGETSYFALEELNKPYCRRSSRTVT